MPAKQGDSPALRSLNTRWNALVLETDNLIGPCATSRRSTLCSLGPTHTAQKDSLTGGARQIWRLSTVYNIQAESSLSLPFLPALVHQWQLGEGKQEVVSKTCPPGASWESIRPRDTHGRGTSEAACDLRGEAGCPYQVQRSLSLFLGVMLKGLSRRSLVLTSQLVLGYGLSQKAAPGPIQGWGLGCGSLVECQPGMQ